MSRFDFWSRCYVVSLSVLPFGSGFLISHAIQSLPEFRRGTVAGENFRVLKWMWLAYRGAKLANAYGFNG